VKKTVLLVAALATIAPFSARAADPVTLKLAFPPPPISFFNGGVLAPWAKEIEAGTNGAVKVQIFVGPTLANFNNIYDRLLNGVIDLGWGLHGPLGNQFPKSAVATLPGLPATGSQCSKALWGLYASGVSADEYEKVRPLSIACFPRSSFIASKPVRSIDDLKGMKAYVGSKMQGLIVERLGGAPITGNTSDIYSGLQRGTFEAATTGWAAVAAFKLFEVSKYGFEAPLGHPTNFLLMNKDSFAKLPETARKVIETKSGAPLVAQMGKAGDNETTHGRQLAEKTPGYTITTMAEGELEKLQRAMQPLVDQWVKETPGGARVLAAYKAELARAQAETR
jgi:TRAP-type C4-dicarboxylate transport system substrate-binding protein